LLLALLLASVSLSHGFAYSNYQLPQKTTNRIRWMQNRFKPGNAGCPPTTGTQDPEQTERVQCQALDRVQPQWKNSPTYTQSFVPLRDMVLISYDQDDNSGVDGEVYGNQQWDTWTGIVVAAGPLASSVAIGNRIYISRDCTRKFVSNAAQIAAGSSNVAWTDTYSYNKAKSMFGRLVNGVSLNNGNAWGMPGTPSMTTFKQDGLRNDFGNPSRTAEDPIVPILGGADTGTGPILFDDPQWYPGNVGTGWWPRLGLNQNYLNEFAPPDNPNQQSNYLLCPQSQIFGVVNQESFANTRGSHYVSPASAFDVSNRGQGSKDGLPY